MAKTINNQQSATADDVLAAVNTFADETHQEFSNIKGEISGIKGDISGINGEISGIKGDISGIKGEIIGIKATMVTKDYLDEKMSDLRGDLVVMMRKEDTKLKTLVGVLKEKSVLDSSDVKRIYSMEPFAQ